MHCPRVAGIAAHSVILLFLFHCTKIGDSADWCKDGATKNSYASTRRNSTKGVYGICDTFDIERLQPN